MKTASEVHHRELRTSRMKCTFRRHLILPAFLEYPNVKPRKLSGSVALFATPGEDNRSKRIKESILDLFGKGCH